MVAEYRSGSEYVNKYGSKGGSAGATALQRTDSQRRGWLPKQSVQLKAERADELRRLLQEGVQHSVFPGAVLVLGRNGEVVFESAVGVLSNRLLGADGKPYPTSMDTVFDIASITAGVATTTMILRLLEQGLLRLEDRVSRHIEGFGILGKSHITIGQLLTHTSGLPHWHPFFEDLQRDNVASRLGLLTSQGAQDYVLTSIVRSQVRADQGERYLFSDIGLILLGAVVETLTGVSLDRAFFRLVAQPLGLKSTSFIDHSILKQKGLVPAIELIAPTEDCAWRKRIMCGEVHDDNAWAMGGVAGHSGLFAMAKDLHRFAQEMLRACRGTSNFLGAETMRKMLEGMTLQSGQQIKLGWDSPTRENGLAGVGLSSQAFGYNGFTGCSMWIDPAQDISLVLMSNRLHPSRANKKILAFRPELFKLAIEALLDPPTNFTASPPEETATCEDQTLQPAEVAHDRLADREPEETSLDTVEGK